MPVAYVNFVRANAVAASATTASHTPGAAGNLLVAFVHGRRSSGTWAADSTTLTDSLGGTWTKLGEGTFDVGTNPKWVVGIFARTVPDTTALTFTGAATGAVNAFVSVMEFSGAGIPSNWSSAGDAAGDPSVSLPVAPAATSAIAATFNSSGGNNITPPTGYTEVWDNGTGFEGAYRLTVPSGTLAWTTAQVNGIGAAVEVPEAGGGGSVTGTLTSTLAALTSTGTASNLVTGVESATLDALASSGAASVRVAGTSSSTLGTLTSSATGSTGGITGTSASTLGALTSSGAGTVRAAGTAAVALAAMVSAAAGNLPVVGTSSGSLAALTASATGVASSSPRVGTANVTLAAMSAAGAAPARGAALPTLDAVAIAGQGAVRVVGSLSAVLAPMSTSGSIPEIQGRLTVRLSGTSYRVATQEHRRTLRIIENRLTVRPA